MRKLSMWSGLPLLAGLAAVASVVAPRGAETQAIADTTAADALAAGQVETLVVQPDSEYELAAPAPALSRAELEALLTRKLQLREQLAARAESSGAVFGGLLPSRGRETVVSAEAQTEFHGTPSALVVGRNNRNTRANSNLGSTLAEPSAANNARLVFAAGNLRHAEYSTDGGATWTDVALPAGPASAPIQLGDQDMIMDDARRVIFHSALYTNNTVTDGVFRIFVRRTIPIAPGLAAPAACSYTIDPPGAGIPDYPHIGLTKRFVYVTINGPSFNGSSARIYRFDADQMADCVTAATTTFSSGGRVWTPAGGTNNLETMYWGQHDNTSTFRIFSWPEAAAAPSSVARPIATSNFTNSDCRGGTNNTDWIERGTSWSISGFRLRGAAAPSARGGQGVLAFYWNVGVDAAHTQGHVHSAVFALAGLGVVAQPHIFNNAFCFGYPVVTSNSRGDIGLSIAYGGRAGGGGGSATAVRGAIGVDDEFTTGIGFFGTVVATAGGTHNPPPGPPDDPAPRFGDYFTIHPYEPCEKWFSATNYALLNGTSVAAINSRYVEFGRQQSRRCYNAHRDQLPAQ